MKKHKLESTFINPESISKRVFHNSDAYKKKQNDKVDGVEIYNIKKILKNTNNNNNDDDLIKDEKNNDGEITVKDYKNNNNTINEDESHNNNINNY